MATEAFEVIVSGHLAGQFVQNVFHFQVTDSGSGSVYQRTQDIAYDMAMSTKFLEKLLTALPESFIGSSLRVRRVGPTGGPTYYLPSGAWVTINGQRDEEISSAQLCPLLIWVPTVAPAKTGRTFLPGIAETDIDDMAYVAGFVTVVLAFATYFIAAHTTGTITYRGGVYRRATFTVDILSGAYLSPLVGTQRRRLKPV